MADKRMFNKKITETDAFLEMPATTQLLYFHLNMNADDEGFVANPKTIMRIVSSKDDDFKILVAKRFIITFESGVVVIKHWFIHNTIRSDRLKETTHQKEKELLSLKPNNSYTDRELEKCQPSDNQVTTECQLRLDQIRLDQTSIEEENIWSESNEKLKELLCGKFGITELKFPQQFMLITKAITLKQNKGPENYEWFKEQCWFYFKYKELEKEKTHGFKSFMGELEDLDKGAWNNENWSKKYHESKREQKVDKPTTVQPARTRRLGASSSLKDLIPKK